ncbi:LytTR family DNA-binding domain-containing protein [Microbulbifer yueqingensis]|nr:LytTR family DNA-binding domain-containing protein [Microbulbifer yueqingensis]
MQQISKRQKDHGHTPQVAVRVAPTPRGRAIWRPAAILAAGAVFILLAFQPFGTAGDTLPFKGLKLAGYALPVALAAMFGGICRHLLIARRASARGRWWFESLVALVTLLLAAPLSYCYFVLVISPHPWTLDGMLYFFRLAFLVGALPTAYLVHSTVTAERNRPRPAGNPEPAAPAAEPGTRELELIGENRGDRIRLPQSAILWISSADNYCEIFHDARGGVAVHLLRSSLTALERQLQHTSMVRCHRGYLVNLDRVIWASGNSAGYRLTLDGTDTTIPVSRRYVAGLQPQLSRIS